MANILPRNLREGLVLWLDEKGNDLSGLGNNGTLVNSPTVVRRLQQRGLSYNGSNQAVNIPNINGLLSFSAWIYPTANNKTILTISSGNTINLSSSNTITFTGITGGTVYVNGTTVNSITLNKWQLITCTFNSINSSSGSIATSSFTGNIINPMLYNRTPDVKEFNQLYIAQYIK